MKLVRGKIPALYKAGQLRNQRGTDHSFRAVRDQEELVLLLRLKLAEEAGEVLSAPSREELIKELGDLMDVIDTLAALSGISAEELDDSRRSKRLRLGDLMDGWVLK